MTTSTTDAEAIARIISRAMLDNPTGGTSEERAQKRRAIAAEYASIIAEALTAPGATTKSDGGAKAGSSPILASKEEQRPDTHGMMPVGDNAANVGCTGVGPSDPSSPRSDVTVAIIDEALASLEGDAVERAARDNYRLVNYLERLPIKKQLMAGTEVDVVEPQYLLAADRDYIVRILATSLVPDEAAVRADEREKCAAEVERRNWPNVGDASRIAAAIRSGGMRDEADGM